jgi:hypothetical protein
MTITIYHLNRNGEKIGSKEIDLSKYEKIGATGNGLAFKPKRGKIIEAYFNNVFYDWYKRDQEMLEESAGRTYHYDLIDKNLPDRPNNRKRDKKGRPIRIFTEYEDLYKKYNVAKWWFIDKNSWDMVKNYLKEHNMTFWDYYNNEWRDDL